MNSVSKLNELFAKVYAEECKDLSENRKIKKKNQTLGQLVRKKYKEKIETYIDNLPPLSAGTYKIKLLKDFNGGWDYLEGKAGDIVLIENCGVRSEERSMGTRHRAGCINVDGGMSPSWLFIPGFDIEIIERLEREEK